MTSIVYGKCISNLLPVNLFLLCTRNNISMAIKPDTEIELKKSTAYSVRVYENIYNILWHYVINDK